MKSVIISVFYQWFHCLASELRIEKLNNLLREELSNIIDREIEFPEGFLVTVTKVAVSPDVHYAAVFISVLGGNAKSALEILQKNIYHVQQMLNRRLRMRPVPKISFAVDEEEENRESVERSLAELKRRGEL